MADFCELLMERRSIRDFDETEVPLGLIREIVKDSCLAPSSENRQPWRFIIVNNKEWIRRLSNESKKNLLLYLEKNPDLFDAVEYSGFLAPGLNFNRRGLKFAERTGKPLLGFGDIHYLWQLGRTYTWIYAEPEIQSILSAIRQGLVRIETSPLSWPEAAWWWMTSLWRAVFPANSPPGIVQSDKIEDGRCFGTAQKRMESQGIHVGK